MARILIIGAGASGLMAAINAAEQGAEVTVLEHKSEAGIKLSLTGNGRCNYTNTDVSADKYYCDNREKRLFVEAVLSQFGYEDCIAFSKQLGIEPEIKHYIYDESGYVYPKDMGAVGFRDVMYRAAVERGVRFCFNVQDADIAASVGYDAVIIATGSNAYPVTGSDSSIYPALQKLGVSPYRFLPALCALYSKDEYLSELKGKRIKTEAVLKTGGREYKSFGEVQFNEHSISGIPVMQLSRYAAKALSEDTEVTLSIDGHDYKIHRTAGFDRAQTCTGGIDTAEIDPYTMRYLGRMAENDDEGSAYDAHSAKGIISSADSAYGTHSDDGITVLQNTECKSTASNLYFCGEIIDIDGECGGYNLHFAWATGYIAGRAAATQVRK